METPQLEENLSNIAKSFWRPREAIFQTHQTAYLIIKLCLVNREIKM